MLGEEQLVTNSGISHKDIFFKGTIFVQEAVKVAPTITRTASGRFLEVFPCLPWLCRPGSEGLYEVATLLLRADVTLVIR